MMSLRILLSGFCTASMLLAAQIAGAEPMPRHAIAVADTRPASCGADASPLLVAQANAEHGEKPTGRMQERAVARMGQEGMAPQRRRRDVGGGVIENNRLTAKPGYVVEVQPDNQAVLKPVGGGPGIKVACQCSSGLGAGCVLESVGPGVICTPGGFSKCKGSCTLVNAPKAMQGQKMQ
jgi:hypothetical protein